MYQVHLVKRDDNMVMMTSKHLYSLQEANEFISTMSSLKDSYMFILNPIQLSVNNNTNQSDYVMVNNQDIEVIENTNDVDDEVDNIMTSLDGDLEGLIIIKSGRGLFITPYEGHKDYGTKYFHNGWWMVNGWFFKKEFYQDLINQGAIPTEDVIHELGFPERQPLMNQNVDVNNNLDEENTSIYSNLEGLEITKYGKGYLIGCPNSHKDYRNKYFHNGWWNEKQQGWFFKKECYPELIKNGATPSQEVKNLPFLEMSYEYYGIDNILLQCYDTHPHYKEVDFYGGEWNYQADGWLFDKRYRIFLEENGAVYEHNEEEFLKDCSISKIDINTKSYYLIKPDRFNKYYELNIMYVSGIRIEWDNNYNGWIVYEKVYGLSNKTERERIKIFTDRGAIYIE